ncbi:WD40 repeat domain-containing serine/threonine protein kinase [Nonomuraea jiangxiensis]|nr:WD40 repeat domain-containing serine/threonine protein kinase [Nonomuraea jiangxiensis]
MTPSPLTSGDPQRLGDLELLGRLGAGGQGVVYLATDSTGARVAVKWLRQDQSDDAANLGRFLREAEVAQRVAPFCTAAVLGTGVEQERPYIVSEFVEGLSLQQAVQQDGPRTGAALDRLAIGTATALAAIHQAEIVHRDFKPANVILAADGPRVIDFGIARALSATSTFSNTPIGTPAYMSPEQINGAAVGPASDLFSWAGTMVFASCGRPPFGDGPPQPLINRVFTAQPDLGRLDGPLRDVVRRCLAKDPAARPTAEQVIRLLLGHPVPDANLLVRGAEQAAVSGRPTLEPRRNRRPLAIGLAAAAALVLAAAVTVPTMLRNDPAATGSTTAPATGTTSGQPETSTPPPTAPATLTRTTLPGGSIRLYERPADRVTLTAYEVYDKKLKDDIDYARQSLHGSFERYPENWESLVSPDGRYLAGRAQEYTSDDYDSVLFTDRQAGSTFRVKTVKEPLISTIRSWSKDGSKLLLNIDRKTRGEDGKDEWVSLGFAVVDVPRAEVSVVNVADDSVRGSDFGWDGHDDGVVIGYGDDAGLRFFDLSGKATHQVAGVGPLASGTTELFSPSGKLFVTECPTGGDGETCVWATDTGKKVREFSSDCDKVLGWYDESHLFCWEQDNNATHNEVRVVAFDGKLTRKLLETSNKLDFTPYFTVTPAGGS